MFFSIFSRRPLALASSRRTSVEPPIDFTPDRILAGIRYHLVDEGLVASFDEASEQAAQERLTAEQATVSVSRATWDAFTDRQRLEWLLDQSGIAVSITLDGQAIFGEAAWNSPHLSTVQ